MATSPSTPPAAELSVVLGAPPPPGWIDGGHPLAPRVSWSDGQLARLRVVVSFDLFTQMQAELHRYRAWLCPDGELDLQLRAAAAPRRSTKRPTLVLATSSGPPLQGFSSAWGELVAIVPPAVAASWRSALGDDDRARVIIAAANTTQVTRLNLGLALARGDRIVVTTADAVSEPETSAAAVVRSSPASLTLQRSALERLGALHPGFVSARRALDDFALRAHASGIPTMVAREALEGPMAPNELRDAPRFSERWGMGPGATWPKSLRPPATTLAVPALPDPALTHEATADGRTWRPRAASPTQDRVA